ncbi:MAG: site-specific DNA-methyltransferase [Nitrososphaeraceae archaeon]|nr:site-specific DNA-methyltransferase [Nitrososphaeraceae archaeon]
MIELNKIYQEDCLHFMKKIIRNGVPVDVIVTSPPYNINKNYRSYVDKKERNEYLSWLSEIARTSYNILKNEASFFLNVSGAPSDSLLPLEVAKAFFDSGYKLQNTIHWIKSISIEKEDLAKTGSFSPSKNVSLGHFKPIISERFLNDFHEYIFHFTKDGDVKLDKLAIGVPYQDKTNIGRWKSSKEDKRDRGNVWFIPYQTIRKERPHPAIFPERLPYLCIKLHGIKKGMLVYDPFMGIGNTALACIQLNVNFIGTEIDYGYIQSAKERIDNLLNYRRHSKTSQNTLKGQNLS